MWYYTNVSKILSKPDSKIRPFIAYSDGAYIYDNGTKQIMYGKAFLFENGNYLQISNDDTITDITKLVQDKFSYNNYNLIKE